uniref:Uncharacterized protein n=1 Tax=Brassica oleracea var. oleracea TaxID=109376 RepID=A0A0D3E9A5_BRAOL
MTRINLKNLFVCLQSCRLAFSSNQPKRSELQCAQILEARNVKRGGELMSLDMFYWIQRYIRGFCFAFEAKKKWRSWRSTWPELCTKHKPFHFHSLRFRLTSAHCCPAVQTLKPIPCLHTGPGLGDFDENYHGWAFGYPFGFLFGFGSGISDFRIFWYRDREPVRVFLYFGSGSGIFSSGSVILNRVRIFRL